MNLRHIDDHPLWFRIYWKAYIFLWFRVKVYRLLPKRFWGQRAIISDQSATQAKYVARSYCKYCGSFAGRCSIDMKQGTICAITKKPFT